MARKIKAGKIDYEADHWESLSIEATDFVEKLLVKDPAERMDAASLLKESWLNTETVEERLQGLTYPAPQWEQSLGTNVAHNNSSMGMDLGIDFHTSGPISWAVVALVIPKDRLHIRGLVVFLEEDASELLNWPYYLIYDIHLL